MPCLSTNAISFFRLSVMVSKAESQSAVPLTMRTVRAVRVNSSPNGSAVCATGGVAGGAGACAAGGLAGGLVLWAAGGVVAGGVAGAAGGGAAGMDGVAAGGVEGVAEGGEAGAKVGGVWAKAEPASQSAVSATGKTAMIWRGIRRGSGQPTKPTIPFSMAVFFNSHWVPAAGLFLTRPRLFVSRELCHEGQTRP